MHLHTQRPRLAHQAKGELERVHAHSIGLPHGGVGVALVAVLFAQLLGAQHLGLVAKNVAPHPGLLFQVGHFFFAVRHVQMAAVEGVAVNLAGERLEVFKAGADFGVQRFGGVQAPARYPL